MERERNRFVQPDSDLDVGFDPKVKPSPAPDNALVSIGDAIVTTDGRMGTVLTFLFGKNGFLVSFEDVNGKVDSVAVDKLVPREALVASAMTAARRIMTDFVRRGSG